MQRALSRVVPDILFSNLSYVELESNAANALKHGSVVAKGESTMQLSCDMVGVQKVNRDDHGPGFETPVSCSSQLSLHYSITPHAMPSPFISCPLPSHCARFTCPEPSSRMSKPFTARSSQHHPMPLQNTRHCPYSAPPY